MDDQAMLELTGKLDKLTAQVQYLTEQAQCAERARQARTELMRDVMPIAGDAMRLATEQLQDVEVYLEPAALVRLLKKLAQAAPALEFLLDQLHSGMELVDVAAPIGKEGFRKAEMLLDQLDRKGYFTFAQEGMQIVDNIVSSFTPEDVRQLGENVVLILRTVKEMTQPEVMNLMHNTLQVIGPDSVEKVDSSLPSLVGQLRDPSVRRGLALTMRMLRNLGTQEPANDRRAPHSAAAH